MIERVLVPLDGSTGAESVFPHLRAFLGPRDAQLILLQVVAPYAGGGDSPACPAADLREDAERDSDRMEQRLASGGVRVRGLVRTGAAEEVILETVAGERVSLVAMTTKG